MSTILRSIMSDRLLKPTGPGLSALVSALRDWHDRYRLRRQISHLDDHLLDDIGLDRHWQSEETRRPYRFR